MRSLEQFIEDSPTPYHASDAVAEILAERGFVTLAPDEPWSAGAVARHAIRLGDGGIIAIDSRSGDFTRGIGVLAAHTDSPALRIKERAAAWKHGYLTLPTEIYGGPIRSTWLDRPLCVAGIVVTAEGTVHRVRLSEQAIIPNLAIHLNRKVNEGFEYNAHDHLVALLRARPGVVDGPAVDDFLDEVAADALDTDERPSEVELYLVDGSAASSIGDGSMFCAPRIDNLAGCYANLVAFLDADGDRPRALVLYNHEEIGSGSGEGAQSDAVIGALRRYFTAIGLGAEDLAVAVSRSTVISNDAAHGIHPSFSDKYDRSYAPRLGGGPVLKTNGMYRYATTAATGALFGRACHAAGVPMQRLSNRADAPSGSTVGPMSWARTGIKTVDVGIPLLAMHSIRETASHADIRMLTAALRAFLEIESE